MAAKALRDQFSRSNTELPEGVRDFLKKDGDEHGDPKVTYSIIMETKNLHVESTFDQFVGQRQRRSHADKYILGPLTTHQLEKQHRSAEVITICPER
jgi:hypothetical protein